MTSSSPSSGRSRVVVLVIASKKADPAEVLSGIQAQVYKPAAVVIVPDIASANLEIMRGKHPADYYWLMDAYTVPRPNSLLALVEGAQQVDAAIVGPKILNRHQPEEILSVGAATDVFGYPYTGLERGEVDQGQYDVIRDVSYVEPANLLIRRDLAVGIRGLDPKLPYLSAGLDLCRRTRLLGGRVVVAPGAQVLRQESAPHKPTAWREQAGRVRVMLKTYSLLTLLWTLPSLFFLGLVMGLFRMFRGSLQGPAYWGAGWLWNLLHLPSTITSRSRKTSTAGDTETFRYQVRGSVELREVGAALGSLLGEESEDDLDDEVALEGSSAFWRRPGATLGAAVVIFLVVYFRSLVIDGLPITGYVLPLADSAGDTLRAYAGGWNPAGLGSPQPMHPSVGATALLQLLFAGRSALAATLITVLAVTAGFLGVVRLTQRLRMGRPARFLAGVVFVAGFPVLALAGEGYWPGVLALGGLPWALAGIIAPLPDGWLGRVGRVGRIGLATACSAVFLPFLVLVPLGFGVIWSLVTRSIRPAGRGLAGLVLALPVLFPWLGVQDVGSLWKSGPGFYLTLTPWFYFPAAVMVVLLAFSVRGRPARVVMVGALIGGAGFLAARLADFGAGREVTAAGHVVASLGLGLVVAGAMDGPRALAESGGVRRSLAGMGLAAGLMVALFSLPALAAGQAGLDTDRFDEPRFAASRSQAPGIERLLLVGPASTMPGSTRMMEDGTAFRLLNGLPDYPQAWLPDPLAGDEALATALEFLAEGSELRPGQVLAPFGIRWVMFTGDTQLGTALQAQLDMRPLTGLSPPVLENDELAYRAVTSTGQVWERSGPDFTGPAENASLRLAENADLRWGPDSRQDEWALEVSTTTGKAAFGGVGAFRVQAWWALGVAFLSLVASVAGRSRVVGPKDSPPA